MMPIAPYNEIIQQIMPTSGCPVLILNGIRMLDNRQMLTITDMPPNANKAAAPGNRPAEQPLDACDAILDFCELHIPFKERRKS